MTRQLVWKMLGADHPMEAHKIDSRAIVALGQSPDAHEGVGAFLAKRKAEFRQRPSREMPGFYPWWRERKFE
jgi:enoyl-CoA hydratase/carnithine racemase